MNHLTWSRTEKTVARQAFDLAYKRECEHLAAKIKEKTKDIKDPADLWRLHSFLSKQLKGIEEKYDYRYSVLIFVFARLIREGWLTESDLDGITPIPEEF